MKTAIILFFLFTFFSIYAHAQNVAVLNINLYPVQTIEVNSASQTVDLDYKTRDDYRDGVSVTKTDHLKIFSTAAFAVKVRSEKPTLTNPDSTNSINSSDITMTASQGTSTSGGSFTSSPVQLSGSDAEFLSSSKGGTNNTFNVKYAASGGDKYINKRVNGQSPTVYTTQVVFSIEPR